jgi:hypothetical protein
MSYPADIKSIRARARVLEVLREMVAGDDFFFTPGVVYDNFKNWAERQTYPSYCVFFGEGGEWAERQGLQAAETFIIIVHGDFKDDEDAPATVRKGIRDVRKAVMDDAATGGISTSLQVLCDHVTLGKLTTDNGTEAMVGSGWFDQEFSIIISGKIEDL